MMCSSSDEDNIVSLRLINRNNHNVFFIEKKKKDYLSCCQIDNHAQYLFNKKTRFKHAVHNARFSWFYLWFFVIIWLPVLVLVSFILIDPFLAFLSVGMYVFSLCIIVIVLTLYFFRKHKLSAVIHTIFWEEFLIIFTFIMGFSVSYNGLVLKGSHFETYYDFWGIISIATNSLEASILKFLSVAKKDRSERMRRIITLYYYFISVFHQSYNVTASMNFIETMKWIKRIEPIVNDLYKYGEYTFIVDNDGKGHKNKHCTIKLKDLDVTALDMIMNEDKLGLRRIFVRGLINNVNNEQDHYHRYATMPVVYVKYIWPSLLLLSMCGNVLFQFWFSYQLFHVYICWVAILIQCVFIAIAVLYVLGKREWLINGGWNFRILRNPTVFAAISCFSDDEIEEQINKLYKEFNERKQSLSTLNMICDRIPEYGLNQQIIDVIVNFVVDETKNIQKLTTKKRNRLIARSSYVWKYMVRQHGAGSSMMECYQHIMHERENALHN